MLHLYGLLDSLSSKVVEYFIEKVKGIVQVHLKYTRGHFIRDRKKDKKIKET